MLSDLPDKYNSGTQYSTNTLWKTSHPLPHPVTDAGSKAQHVPESHSDKRVRLMELNKHYELVCFAQLAVPSLIPSELLPQTRNIHSSAN